MTLSSLGWSSTLERAFAPHSLLGLVPARIALEHKHAYRFLSPLGEGTAVCTGRLLHLATSRHELPAVGDWVALKPRTCHSDGTPHFDEVSDIHAVLPRASCLSRRAAGPDNVEQVLAANVDTVFIVSGLDENYNPRRIERYLAVVRAGGAQPVLVLNKADLQADLSRFRAELVRFAPGVPSVFLSATQGEVDSLSTWLQAGKTIALLGSSGVGKSTLINRLLGRPMQNTGALSDAVNKGRHTTTHRQLFHLKEGALMIDTPGLRELQFWNVDEASLEETFNDVAQLARRCRFDDCAHHTEPGCAVLEALERGTLLEERWQSYLKLQREQAYVARRADPRLARAERERWKKINRSLRQRGRSDPMEE